MELKLLIQMDRHTDSQTGIQTVRQAHRQTDKAKEDVIKKQLSPL